MAMGTARAVGWFRELHQSLSGPENYHAFPTLRNSVIGSIQHFEIDIIAKFNKALNLAKEIALMAFACQSCDIFKEKCAGVDIANRSYKFGEHVAHVVCSLLISGNGERLAGGATRYQVNPVAKNGPIDLADIFCHDLNVWKVSRIGLGSSRISIHRDYGSKTRPLESKAQAPGATEQIDTT